MARLLIYNPEHDTCLARNVDHFVIPAVALKMRREWGHMPAYWAEDGDMVVVANVEEATRRLEAEHRHHARVNFVTMDRLTEWTMEDMPSEIVPWGWDKNIAKTLATVNPLFRPLLPNRETLAEIRRMSSRVWVAREFLPRLIEGHSSWLCNMRVFFGTPDSLIKEVESSPHMVLKAPWSNSGKGVRMVGGTSLTANDCGWISNVLSEQGAIVVEPRYDKLMDFAMEFIIHRDYIVEYLGLSLFTTKGGTYQGNIIASHEEKRQMVERYLPHETLTTARDAILKVAGELFKGRYAGPFGVDMMVVKTPEGVALNPCVEVNLRWTMGHAFL